jgi:dTDP-4-dehydrorhamnose 3,5-epimerase
MDLIQGVTVRPLKQIHDERGYLMEMLRTDWPEFERFAQSYITIAYPGIVKGWHYHKKQTDHFVCVGGVARVVLHDTREGSPTFGETDEFVVGWDVGQKLIVIPTDVYHGFTAVGDAPAFIVNIPTEVYDAADPDEYRLPYDDASIGYDWGPEVVMGG